MCLYAQKATAILHIATLLRVYTMWYKIHAVESGLTGRCGFGNWNFPTTFSDPPQKNLFQLLIYLLKGLNWEFGSLKALYDIILLSRVLNNTWIFVTGVYDIGIVKGCTKRVKIDQKPDTKLVFDQKIFAYIHPVWAVVILAKVWTLIINPIKVIISSAKPILVMRCIFLAQLFPLDNWWTS